MGIWTVAGLDRHKPAACLVLFGMKSRLFGHTQNLCTAAARRRGGRHCFGGLRGSLQIEGAVAQ
jgi:hypothetical protein